jgi:hypothetical protein
VTIFFAELGNESESTRFELFAQLGTNTEIKGGVRPCLEYCLHFRMSQTSFPWKNKFFLQKVPSKSV